MKFALTFVAFMIVQSSYAQPLAPTLSTATATLAAPVAAVVTAPALTSPAIHVNDAGKTLFRANTNEPAAINLPIDFNLSLDHFYAPNTSDPSNPNTYLDVFLINNDSLSSHPKVGPLRIGKFGTPANLNLMGNPAVSNPSTFSFNRSNFLNGNTWSAEGFSFGTGSVQGFNDIKPSHMNVNPYNACRGEMEFRYTTIEYQYPVSVSNPTFTPTGNLIDGAAVGHFVRTSANQTPASQTYITERNTNYGDSLAAGQFARDTSATSFPVGVIPASLTRVERLKIGALKKRYITDTSDYVHSSFDANGCSCPAAGCGAANGTQTNPIRLKLPIQNIRNCLDANGTTVGLHYSLEDNLDFATYTPPAGGGSLGVMNRSFVTSNFRGVFQGNGHIISNLFIVVDTTSPATGDIGFFSRLTGQSNPNVAVEVHNLRFKDSLVANWNLNGSSIGTLVGLADRAIINNVRIFTKYGAVADQNIGGAVGRVNDQGLPASLIRKVSMDGGVGSINLAASSNAGGIVGLVSGASSSNRAKIEYSSTVTTTMDICLTLGQPSCPSLSFIIAGVNVGGIVGNATKVDLEDNFSANITYKAGASGCIPAEGISGLLNTINTSVNASNKYWTACYIYARNYMPLTDASGSQADPLHNYNNVDPDGSGPCSIGLPGQQDPNIWKAALDSTGEYIFNNSYPAGPGAPFTAGNRTISAGGPAPQYEQTPTQCDVFGQEL